MIFTSQLGTLEGRTDSEAIKSIANHVRRMQEELEYRLSVLDSSNISEIDAGQTIITMEDGKPIQNVIEDANGNYSKLEQTVNGLSVRVGNAEGRLTAVTVTANGLSSKVSTLDGDVSALTQTVKGFQTRVETAEGKVSTLTQTVNGFQTRVETAEGNVSTLTQTVNGFQTRVDTAEGNASTALQTANSFSQRITTAEGKYSAIEQNADSISAIVENVGEDGTVTAASIAAKIKDDRSLIELIAGEIHIAGDTIFSTNGYEPGDDEYQAVQIVDGAINLMDQDGYAGGSIWYSDDKYLFSITSEQNICISTAGNILMEGDKFTFELPSGNLWQISDAGIKYVNSEGTKWVQLS